MELSIKLPFVFLTFIVCASLGTNFSVHRTKRDVTENFRKKHITFVREGTAITFNLLKNSLPDFANAEDRVWHTFIIVFLNKGEKEEKQKTSFWAKLYTVMSKKIRSNVCGNKIQDTLRVCETFIQKHKPRIKKTDVRMSGYRLCSVSLTDLGPNTYMANFNPQDKKVPCKYSAQGMFNLGAGLVQNRVQSDKKTDWFIVNHLEKSKLYGKVINCMK